MNNIHNAFHNKSGDIMSNLFDDYELNLLTFKDDFKDSSDFLLKELQCENGKMFLACMDGLVNSLLLSQMIVEPICDFDKKAPDAEHNSRSF